MAVLLVARARPGLACEDLAQAPSSRWTVATVDGASWLEDPCGDRFFSIGVNGLDGGDGRGLSLPPRAYLWSSFQPSFADWLNQTRGRLRSWGFNTAGAISATPAELALPSIPSLALGQSAAFHWVDPFAPEMPERLRAKAVELVAPFRGQPRRIGYFTDNEVGWWGGALFTFYARQPASNHTKQAWVRLLRERYDGSWERFVADFVPSAGVSSWDELLAAEGVATRLRPGGAGIQAVRAFTGLVARRYYQTVHEALRAADPEALDFGDRLPIYYDPVAVRAMAPFVDVIASNYNVDAPDGWIARYFFDGFARLAPSKPVLVSEWFFAARENRSGNTNNGHLMTVATQDERARGAAAAARSLAAEPNVAGLHWFQYYDQPTGGRPVDGEDYDFGLVDVDDRPYPQLIEALTQANHSLAGVHAQAARARLRGTAAAATDAREIPFATIDPDDGSLADWPKPAAWVDGLEARDPEVPFGDVYLSWSDAGLAIALIAMDYYDPALLDFDGPFPSGEALHADLGLDAGSGARRFRLSVVPPRVFEKRAAPAFEPRLCVAAPGGCEPLAGVRLHYFGSDQPRYVVEAVIPWTALGLESAPTTASLLTALAVTAFHRARWMSFDAEPPEALLASTDRWRPMSLGGRAESRDRLGGHRSVDDPGKAEPPPERSSTSGEASSPISARSSPAP